MELALSLGDPSKPFQSLQHKTNQKMALAAAASKSNNIANMDDDDLGFCMGLRPSSHYKEDEEEEEEEEEVKDDDRQDQKRACSSEPPAPLQQLELLPFSPVPRHQHHQQQQPEPSSQINLIPWMQQTRSLISRQNYSSSDGSGGTKIYQVTKKRLDRKPSEETAEEVATQSSPNSGASSFQNTIDYFSMYKSFTTGSSTGKRSSWDNNHCTDYDIIARNSNNLHEGETENTTRTGGRGGGGGGSDDDENGSTRKKLRLSKEQSAFLEESFKDHSTLTPVCLNKSNMLV